MRSKQFAIWISLILVLAASSCEKYPPRDNTGLVVTPYVLYLGGLDGEIFQSNDIEFFDRINGNGGPDNTAIRQIITADTNILFLKEFCYTSDDDGRAFNLTNSDPLPYYDAFYKYYLPHQMMYDKSEEKVYLCVNGGLAESSDFGKTFAPSPIGIAPTSVVELDNGDLFAIQDNTNIYTRTSGFGGWSAVTPAPTGLAAGSNYYLTSMGNTLVATDFEGNNGVYFSTDGGSTWTKYGGTIGNGKFILTVESCENEDGTMDLFMGRDSLGVFKLDQGSNSFEASSTGIPWYAKIYDITCKKVQYRTGEVRYFYFCATNVGLYLSENDSAGDAWRLIKEGDYSTLH